MKIGCLASNQYSNGNNHWLTARCEGRMMINAGFGFAEMGHEVSIFAAEFDNQPNIWKNVSLYKYWDQSKHYDLIVAFNPYNGSFGRGMVEGQSAGNNYNKLFYVHYGCLPENIPQVNLLASYPKTVAFFSPSYSGIELHTNLRGELFPKLKPFDFFPQLFPIPCYEKLTKNDFQDYHFDKTKKTLKIWTVSSSWAQGYQGYVSDDSVVEVLNILKDDLGYGIDLTVTSHKDASTIHPDFVKVFNAKVFKNDDYNYKMILDLISNMDICIVKGNLGNPNNSSLDILSLGVPMIYLTGSEKAKPLDFSINPIMRECPDDCIDFRAPHEEKVEKIKEIMSDPEPSFNRMIKARSRERYSNWSVYMEEILKKYC